MLLCGLRWIVLFNVGSHKRAGGMDDLLHNLTEPVDGVALVDRQRDGPVRSEEGRRDILEFRNSFVRVAVLNNVWRR